MTVHIHPAVQNGVPVLRIEGALVGVQAWRVLCRQIVRAVSDGGRVVLDVGKVTGYDDACLAAIQAGLGKWLSVEGETDHLRTLLGRRRDEESH
jgi:hypothetical protein